MFKDLFKNWNTIPNWISFFRIIMIPIFAVLYYKDYYIAALAVLAASGLSDMFDGKIARRFNQVSNLGKILDPVADKLTQITIAIMLFIKFRSSGVPALQAFSWIFLVFIIKEFLMVIIGAIMLSVNLRPSAAEIYGKVATVVFYGVMIILFAFAPEVGAFRTLWVLPNALLITLVAISAFLCVVALISYIPGTYKQFKEKYWSK